MDDFEEFVLARWEDVETVALAALGDPARARELTTDVFDSLRRHWAQMSERGAPTATAHGALMFALLHEDKDRTRVPKLAAHPREDEPADVDQALLRTWWSRGLPERSVLAAQVLWGQAPGTLAAKVDTAPARQALQAALEDATSWAAATTLTTGLDGYLAHALRTLPTSTSDPMLLLDRRAARQAPRRAVVAAGGLAAVGGLAWWLVARRQASSTAAPLRPTATPSPTVAASWEFAIRWPARGALASNPQVQAFAATNAVERSRLVFADDVEGVRVVVTVRPESADANGGTFLQAWSGPAGALGAGLAEIDLGLEGIFGDGQSVAALCVPRGAGSLLLFLTRPEISAAQYSLFARPTREGTIARSWEPVTLTGGVGWASLPAPTGPGMRVRCDYYDGPVPAPIEWTKDVGAVSVDGLRRFVAGVTGFRLAQLRVSSQRGLLPEGTKVEGSWTPGLEVRLVSIACPSGGVARTAVFGTRNVEDSVVGVYSTDVVSAKAALDPLVLRTDGAVGGDAELVAFCPRPDAATAEIVTPNGSRVSARVPLQGSVAALKVPIAKVESGLELVVRERSGRVQFRGPMTSGPAVQDLIPGNEPISLL